MKRRINRAGTVTHDGISWVAGYWGDDNKLHRKRHKSREEAEAFLQQVSKVKNLETDEERFWSKVDKNGDCWERSEGCQDSVVKIEE